MYTHWRNKAIDYYISTICDKSTLYNSLSFLAGFCRHRRPLFRLLVDCVGSSASCLMAQQVVASSHMPYQFARLCKTVQPRTCLDHAYCTDVRLRPSSIIFLDASKAFDKVLHYGLFVRLLKRNVSVGFIHLLVNWYSNLTSCVLWNNCFGDVYKVECGVRQGGILSPISLLYALSIL